MNHIGICMTCPTKNKINTLRLEITNISKGIEKVLYLNKLTIRDIHSCRNFRTRLPLHHRSYNVSTKQLCGRCTKPEYRSFRTLEEGMLLNICSLIKYALSNNIQLEGLNELKRSCRGFNYGSLYRMIDMYQREIKTTVNKETI